MADSSSSYEKFDIRNRKPQAKPLLLHGKINHPHYQQHHNQSLTSYFDPRHLLSPLPKICHRLQHARRVLEQRPDHRWDMGAELLSKLDRRSDDKVVEKNTYSAFRNKLRGVSGGERDYGCDCDGVTTKLCCETTARDAFVRGLRVFFSTDPTAFGGLQEIERGFSCGKLRGEIETKLCA